MKRIFYLLPIVLLAVISCKKDNQPPESTICIAPGASDTVQVALTKGNLEGTWKYFTCVTQTGDIAPIWSYDLDKLGLTFANDSFYYKGRPREEGRPYLLSSFHKPEIQRDRAGDTLLKMVAFNNVDTMYCALEICKARLRIMNIDCEGCYVMYIRN